jgi:group I intron endonuclease
MYTLYMILSEKTSKVYIGQTVDVLQRWSAHLSKAKAGKGYTIHNAMRKYGVDTFDLVPLDTFETKGEVDAAEIRWIAYYKALNRSYNIAPGGEGAGSGENHPLYGKTHTAESKAKMSKSKQGKYTEENSPWWGKTHTEEARAKMSEAKKGITGENTPNYKYPPALIASFPSPKEATIATGISRTQYYKIKKEHPNLPWPVAVRGTR